MIEEKLINLEDALDKIKSGSRIMVGGFAGIGNPMDLINGIAERKIDNITLIGNDTGNDGEDLGVLINNKLITKAIVSHIGTNRETVRQFTEGEIEVEFVPQGTLVERIRSAGFGLGGVLTPTGIGTEMEEGKEVINVDGKDFLLEKPLFADVALVKAKKVDKMGNVVFYGSSASHSPMMLTAADLTIVQADEVVEVGEIKPEDVTIPGIFVNYIVEGSK